MFGRSYEMGMVAAYKVGTGKWKNDVEKFPAMLKKRKIALLPPGVATGKPWVASSSAPNRTKDPKHEVRVFSRVLG